MGTNSVVSNRNIRRTPAPHRALPRPTRPVLEAGLQAISVTVLLIFVSSHVSLLFVDAARQELSYRKGHFVILRVIACIFTLLVLQMLQGVALQQEFDHVLLSHLHTLD